jgi:hypothetical protein
MRIPEYYKKPPWQRFFAGMAMGAIISWLIFLFIYAELQEQQLQIIDKQNSQIVDLEKKRRVLTEDIDILNEENKKKIKIQDIKVEILNSQKFGFDSLIRHKLESSVINDLNHLLTKDINTVSSNKVLLRKAIENRVYNHKFLKKKIL